jgi:hypothetical protein
LSKLQKYYTCLPIIFTRGAPIDRRSNSKTFSILSPDIIDRGLLYKWNGGFADHQVDTVNRQNVLVFSWFFQNQVHAEASSAAVNQYPDAFAHIFGQQVFKFRIRETGNFKQHVTPENRMDYFGV